MFETLFARNPALLVPIIALVGATIVFTVWIIAHYWHALRRQELENSLKQDMLNRGHTPAEIELVVSASSRGPAPTPELSNVEYERGLVEQMLNNGLPAEEIERVIRALREGKDSTAIRLPRRVEA
jgi:hypothetical protein